MYVVLCLQLYYSAPIESTTTESAGTVSTEAESELRKLSAITTLSESFDESVVLLLQEVIEIAANATKAKIIFFIIV